MRHGLQPRTEGFSLREVRQACGLSLRQVENLTGVSRATLSRAERGIEIPTVPVMGQLAALYELDTGGWQLVVEYRALVLPRAKRKTIQGGSQ